MHFAASWVAFQAESFGKPRKRLEKMSLLGDTIARSHILADQIGLSGCPLPRDSHGGNRRANEERQQQQGGGPCEARQCGLTPAPAPRFAREADRPSLDWFPIQKATQLLGELPGTRIAARRILF